jgi:hypothetical protein
MLKNDNELDDRQHHNSMQEHRGRKPILLAKDLLNVEKYLQEEGWDALRNRCVMVL